MWVRTVSSEGMREIKGEGKGGVREGCVTSKYRDNNTRTAIVTSSLLKRDDKVRGMVRRNEVDKEEIGKGKSEEEV